jgi:hypothetical protein
MTSMREARGGAQLESALLDVCSSFLDIVQGSRPSSLGFTADIRVDPSGLGRGGRQTTRLRGPSAEGRYVVVLCGGEAVARSKPYFVQLVDQELRLQLDRVGSIVPLLVLEQAQLQLERLQEDRLHEERLQDDRLQLDRV